jgi:hypothetical protein
MTQFTQELPDWAMPDTDRTPAIEYIVNPVEHTLAFTRANASKELVNLCVGTEDVTLMVFNTEDGDPVSVREAIHLSFEECRILKALLSRPEITALLNEQ